MSKSSYSSLTSLKTSLPESTVPRHSRAIAPKATVEQRKEASSERRRTDLVTLNRRYILDFGAPQMTKTASLVDTTANNVFVPSHSPLNTLFITTLIMNKYEKGDRCLIRGLKSSPELNDSIVEIISPPGSTHPDRYKAKIIVPSQCQNAEGKVLGLKELNLGQCEVQWTPVLAS